LLSIFFAITHVAFSHVFGLTSKSWKPWTPDVPQRGIIFDSNILEMFSLALTLELGRVKFG
jgi:hypothetical protein